MNIERFIADRTPVWKQLDDLLVRAESTDVTRDELQELVALYRRTCSDLNRARSYTANPDVLGYLNQLTGRAYRFIYQAAHEVGDSGRVPPRAHVHRNGRGIDDPRHAFRRAGGDR